MPAKVSLITVYYNTPDELFRLFESIRAFLPEGMWEWIVADNHSRNDLSSQLPGVIYLRLPENYGFGKACNIAAEKASGEYLFFLNPDCELMEDCVTPLLESMKRGQVAGPSVMNPDGSFQLSFGPFLSVLSEITQRFRMHYERSALIQRWLSRKMQQEFAPDYVSGCAMLISTQTFHSLKGFDEHFFLYEEDVDLCKRIHDNHQRVLCRPSAKILHLRNRSTMQESARTRIEYRKSQLYYYRKHHGAFQQLLLKLYLSIRFLFHGEMLKVIWSVSPALRRPDPLS